MTIADKADIGVIIAVSCGALAGYAIATYGRAWTLALIPIVWACVCINNAVHKA